MVKASVQLYAKEAGSVDFRISSSLGGFGRIIPSMDEMESNDLEEMSPESSSANATGLSSTMETDLSPNDDFHTDFEPSKYVGVQIVQTQSGIGYRALVTIAGNQIDLGLFNSEEAAAKVHDRVMIRTSGPKECHINKSLLNFPVQSYAKDALDLFTMFDTNIRRGIFGTNWSGFKEIDFSCLVTRLHKSKDKKRKSEDEENMEKLSPTSSSNKQKVEIPKRFRAVPSEILFQMAKFYPSGKSEAQWGQYHNKNVFIVDGRNGWCQIVFPPLPKDPAPGEDFEPRVMPLLTREHVKPVSVRADVMRKYDGISPRSQIVLLKDEEMTEAELALRDEIIKFIHESDMDYHSKKHREKRVVAAETLEQPTKQEPSGIFSLPQSEPPSIEPSNPGQSEDMGEEDEPVAEQIPKDPAQEAAEDALSRILDGVMQWDEIEELSEELLNNLVNIILTSSVPLARHELLMETLDDILQDGTVIETPPDSGSQRFFTVQKFGLLKEGLKNYISEIQ
jgi:hypothetical protein